MGADFRLGGKVVILRLGVGLASDIKGLSFLQDDATELRNVADNSIVSLSTLHAAGHFGLGRYTDPVDPGAASSSWLLCGGFLLRGESSIFSVPVGRERIEFNAHRVFDPRTILASFEGLELLSFSFVRDDDLLHEEADPWKLPPSEMACGLFEFTKRAASRT